MARCVDEMVDGWMDGWMDELVIVQHIDHHQSVPQPCMSEALNTVRHPTTVIVSIMPPK